MNYLELSLIGVILLYPLIDFLTGKFKSKNKNVEYLKICIFLWGLTSLLAYVYYIEKLSVNKLDYLVEFNWQNLTAITLILMAVVYLMLLIKSIISNEKLRLEVANKFVPYIDLMPTNKSQVLVFTLVLSVTAGICEELIFRGYLYNLIYMYSGNIGAILLSSLVFGYWHIYLGWQEVVRTSVMGALLCGVYIFTGNIIIPIVIHIFIDVYSGVICYVSLRKQSGISANI
jgi:hypothetical protein